MNDIEKAIADISDIRTQLAASTKFRGYAPEVVALAGFASVLIVIAQAIWPQAFGPSSYDQAVLWAAVLLASGLTVLVEALSRARHQHGGLADAMLQGAARVLLPVTLTGAVIGYGVLTHAPGAAWVLPGAWQMLIGVAIFASYATMPSGIVWPALWYLLCGAFVIMLAGASGTLTPLMCGGPLAVGHLSIAWLLHREGLRP